MRTYYIYKATNKINGKVYIGQTVDYKSRLWQHRRCYEKEDCDFHDAIKEFGFDNFEWEVIGTCEEENRADDLEKFYIEKYDSYRNGYNMTKGGKGASMWNARPVVRLTLDGEFIKRYDSAGETKKDGFWDSDVLLNCKNISYSCKGYLFMFEDEYIMNGAKTYQKPESKNMKSIIQCDKDGNFIEKYKSVKEASEKTKIRRTTISGVLTKKYKLAGGYIFVYENNFPIKDLGIYKQNKKGKKIAQVDIKSGKIINMFDRISDAGKELGVNYKGIHKVVDNPNRTAFGYKWISQ